MLKLASPGVFNFTTLSTSSSLTLLGLIEGAKLLASDLTDLRVLEMTE